MRDGVFRRVAVPLMANFPGSVTLDNWRELRPYQVRLMFDYLEERSRHRG